jgi:hypothetical protein
VPEAVSANEINRNGVEKVTRTARILDSLIDPRYGNRTIHDDI